jgi:hypothetical protein
LGSDGEQALVGTFYRVCAFNFMTRREAKIQELLNAVERLLTHLGHQVPVEAVHVDDLKKLIKELRNGGE